VIGAIHPVDSGHRAASAGGAGGKKPSVRLDDRLWPFEGVFEGEGAHQEDALYNAAVAPLVDACLDGYNSTILACTLELRS
jgi:hypothetical protein